MNMTKQDMIELCDDTIESYSNALATNDFSELYEFRIIGKYSQKHMIAKCQKVLTQARKDKEELLKE